MSTGAWLPALPTTRMAIVAAKFAVAAVRSVLLAIQAALLGLLISMRSACRAGRPGR
ncbi:hypothetical protein AAH991_02050 [Microbispora sp. ZYX-F-249]|uniref:Uncharacterized protein n=1 Tax=Microbispora maris TaxID=3144104 RepID=A0ABV0AGV4_9ACTN